MTVLKLVGTASLAVAVVLAALIVRRGDDTPRPHDSDSRNGPAMTLAWSVVWFLAFIGVWLMLAAP